MQRQRKVISFTAFASAGLVAPAVAPVVVSAKSIFARLQASFVAQGAQVGGKGGGSPMLALGVLPTQFVEPPVKTMQERVQVALADVACDVAASESKKPKDSKKAK